VLIEPGSDALSERDLDLLESYVVITSYSPLTGELELGDRLVED
jgi:hypothetical protein